VDSLVEWCEKNKVHYLTPNAAALIYRAVTANFHFTPETCREYVRSVMDVLRIRKRQAVQAGIERD
jgi:DNA topoisomerase IB